MKERKRWESTRHSSIHSSRQIEKQGRRIILHLRWEKREKGKDIQLLLTRLTSFTFPSFLSLLVLLLSLLVLLLPSLLVLLLPSLLVLLSLFCIHDGSRDDDDSAFIPYIPPACLDVVSYCHLTSSSFSFLLLSTSALIRAVPKLTSQMARVQNVLLPLLVQRKEFWKLFHLYHKSLKRSVLVVF